MAVYFFFVSFSSTLMKHTVFTNPSLYCACIKKKKEELEETYFNTNLHKQTSIVINLSRQNH